MEESEERGYAGIEIGEVVREMGVMLGERVGKMKWKMEVGWR